MKTLLLMRHAKSAWDDESLSDIQRTLNKRGRRDAPRIGQWIARHGHTPQLVACSASIRTRETAALLLPEFSPVPEIVYHDELYCADVPTLSRVIAATDEAIETLLVLAHNPGMEELIGSLKQSYESLPTAGLAVFELDILGWDTFHPGTPARLLDTITPAQLDDDL